MPYPYVTAEKVRTVMTDAVLIRALNDDPANQTTLNTDKLQTYIDLANQDIDDSLRERYSLPIKFKSGSNSTLAVLEDVALKIVRYEILMRKKDSAPPAGLEQLYKDAQGRLTAYRTGELKLDAEPAIKRAPMITTRKNSSTKFASLIKSLE